MLCSTRECLFSSEYWFDIFSQIKLNMSDYHDLYSNHMYFICGDMNSWTGTLTDYIETDSTRFAPVPNDYVRDSPMYPRANMDTFVNFQGKVWLNSVVCVIYVFWMGVSSLIKGLDIILVTHIMVPAVSIMYCAHLCWSRLFMILTSLNVRLTLIVVLCMCLYWLTRIATRGNRSEQYPNLSGIMINSTPTVKTWLTSCFISA